MTLYKRLADDIRTQIITGRLKPKDRIPSERALMQVHRMSRNTVRQAIDQLVHEGLLTRLSGPSGTIVRHRAVITYHAWKSESPNAHRSEADAYATEIREQGHQPTQHITCAIEAAPERVAKKLDIPIDDPVTVRRCVRYVDNTPWSIQTSYYPQWLVALVPELRSPHDIAHGTTRLLADRGFVQVCFRDIWTSRMPTPEDAHELEMPAGTPLLIGIRIGHIPDGRPIRVTCTRFPADRNRIEYQVGGYTAAENRTS